MQQTSDTFFTQDRLLRYRQLHRRYPLWCGHWPDGLAGAPERTMWTLHRRAQLEGPDLRKRVPEVQRFASSRRLVFFALPDETISRGEPPTVLGMFVDFSAQEHNDGPFQIHATLGRPDQTLLQAVAYTLAQWPLTQDDAAIQAVSGEVDPIEVCIARLSDELRHSFPVIGAPFDRRTPYRWPFGMGNEILQGMPPGPARQRWVVRLREKWLKLGEDIGIAPRLAGGAKCTLEGAFLKKLSAELTALSSEIRDYKAEPDEISLVLRMLMGDGAFQTAAQNAQALAEAKHRRSRAATEPPDWVASLRRSHGADAWALRLAFPMLVAPEIELLCGNRPRTTARPRRVTLPQRVLAGRLGVRASTLQNLLKARSQPEN